MSFLKSSPDKEDLGLPSRESSFTKSIHTEPDEALALAHVIHGAGMSGVAAFALNVLKPLHWMGGQAIWIMQPFIEALGVGSRRRPGAGVGTLSTGGIAKLLERAGGLDELAGHLESLQAGSAYGRRDGGV